MPSILSPLTSDGKGSGMDLRGFGRLDTNSGSLRPMHFC